ncbi:MAG: AraC family transcriptional regulator [Cyclobacteriaceae bacterium]|nr:AraC family transcriptional regulator [Cyclobacteriaceae bacterium HetDA_MAG_MS6]
MRYVVVDSNSSKDYKLKGTEINLQLIRYKKLLTYLEEHLSEEINIQQVESICCYSYRNINRIFQAIHGETIGKYVKRLRLEKAAQFLKYSNMGISQIAYQVGFEDRSAFSKAFSKRYGSSPKDYRNNSEAIRQEIQKNFDLRADHNCQKLQFEIEVLHNFDYLFLEYHGDYRDMDKVYAHWQTFLESIEQKGLLSQHSILMTEIIDDDEIGDHLNSRYRHALILENSLDFEPPELFRIKTHKRQKYAKFKHQGSPKSLEGFYQEIYAFWMTDIGYELVDAPILEFYPNFDENLTEDSQITEIYIAIT